MRPLLVHLVFHPSSQRSRALAESLHRSFNDPVMSLRIPTKIVPEDGTCFPPVDYLSGSAERHFFVVFGDNEMVVEPSSVPAGRKMWSVFIRDLWERCKNGKDNFLPLQLTPYAWPIHDDLKKVHFLRVYSEPEVEHEAYISRMVSLEINRRLLGEGEGFAGFAERKNIPVTIFLSHSKQDISSEPKVFETLVRYLDSTQPVGTWIDSARIEPGSSFEEEILEAKFSALLVLVTKSFSSRTWCRKEVLLAKKRGRPIVVVDAIDGHVPRSFPYLGNVPVISWASGRASQVVDLLLKETLRFLHASLLLTQSYMLHHQSVDVILMSPPEAATVIGIAPARTILYPDPPLGDEELDLLAPLGLSFLTPLLRAAAAVPLTTLKVALSISASGDVAAYGMLKEHVADVMTEVTRFLLIRGAVLVYGGHFGEDSYTVKLFDLVRAHQEISGRTKDRIISIVGWPLTLSVELQARYQPFANFIRVERPAIFAADPPDFILSGDHRYAWACGLTRMREAQIEKSNARIVLGGNFVPADYANVSGWYKGRIPGVLEEALLSLKAKHAVYICGGFGGVGSVIARLIEGQQVAQFSWEHHKNAPFAQEMRVIYERENQWWDYTDIAVFLRTTGVGGLNNGLSDDDNRLLFWSQDMAEIVSLILKGLQQRLSMK